MKINLNWGSSHLDLNLPDEWDIKWPQKKEIISEELFSDELSCIKKAIDSPINMKTLDRLDLKIKKILIVIEDNKRLTPIYKFFHLILDEIETIRGSLNDVLVMPALGLHTPMTEQDMIEKIGKENFSRISWKNHEPYNENANEYLGKTSRGTPIYLNKELSNHDFVILIGAVAPHNWAGFSGGLKNIFPGIAAAESISNHHNILAEPPYQVFSVGLLPEECQFRSDIDEIKKFISTPIFCINVVTDNNQIILDAFAGDPISVHKEGVRLNQKLNARYIDEKVDGIIVNSFPMDKNFKQSLKGVSNSIPALKPGGIVMGCLYAELGLDEMKVPRSAPPVFFLRSILRMTNSENVMKLINFLFPNLNTEDQVNYYYSFQLLRQFNIYLYLPRVSMKDAKKLCFFNPVNDPQKMIDIAAKKMKKNAKVAIFPDAGITFPVVGSK